ncbi:MAG: hypothetical protein EOP08_03515 [Proteobacteria bacterium]|nr:MAG: hypothetical protein EOP08_03515 [Pseudomonadota bacterium]
MQHHWKIVRLAKSALLTLLLVAPAVQADAPWKPGACNGDSKLLNGGPTSVFGEGPGTWWGLISNGMRAAGLLTDSDQIAYLSSVFGQSFATLDEAKAFNLQSVSDGWDKNGNGYVCAFDLRGTRAYVKDPIAAFTFFGIADDSQKVK